MPVGIGICPLELHAWQLPGEDVASKYTATFLDSYHSSEDEPLKCSTTGLYNRVMNKRPVGWCGRVSFEAWHRGWAGLFPQRKNHPSRKRHESPGKDRLGHSRPFLPVARQENPFLSFFLFLLFLIECPELLVFLGCWECRVRHREFLMISQY